MQRQQITNCIPVQIRTCKRSTTENNSCASFDPMAVRSRTRRGSHMGTCAVSIPAANHPPRCCCCCCCCWILCSRQCEKYVHAHILAFCWTAINFCFEVVGFELLFCTSSSVRTQRRQSTLAHVKVLSREMREMLPRQVTVKLQFGFRLLRRPRVTSVTSPCVGG